MSGQIRIKDKEFPLPGSQTNKETGIVQIRLEYCYGYGIRLKLFGDIVNSFYKIRVFQFRFEQKKPI